MKNLVVCGDSFAIGIGCYNLRTEPFGSLLSNKLGLNLINYAKGSSTNFSIFLQAKYAIEKVKDIELLCFSTTSYDRVEWFSGNNDRMGGEITNEDVIYEGYGPYIDGPYNGQLENPMKGNNGTLLTENYYGVIDYVDNVLYGKVPRGSYFHKFRDESAERMVLLKKYYLEIFSHRIQRQYDIGVIIMAHLLLKKNGVPHYIMSPDRELLKYMSEENFIEVNWGEMSVKYPDDLPSLHTSPEGHYQVYQKLLHRITNEFDSNSYVPKINPFKNKRLV